MSPTAWPEDDSPAWWDPTEHGDYWYITYRQRQSCRASGHALPVIGRTINRNGAEGAALHCPSCGDRIQNVKKNLLPVDAPLVFDHSGSTIYPPCERCGDDSYTERHHWAPRYLFGWEEAELWPTANLCRNCHMAWHQTVTPRMGQRRAS